MTITHTAHARYDLWYHLAWATKYRKQIFTDEKVQVEVAALLRDIAAHYDMRIEEIGVLADHVHLLLTAPPRIAPSRAAQILKSVSTRHLFRQYRWLKNHYWGGEIWVAGYFVRSVGPSLTKEQIVSYIGAQSEDVS